MGTEPVEEPVGVCCPMYIYVQAGGAVAMELSGRIIISQWLCSCVQCGR